MQTAESAIQTRKSTGAHYTPLILAKFVAEQILGAGLDKSRSEQVSVLDPAVGDGELLISVLKELSKHGYANVTASGFDTDADAIGLARDRIKTLSSQIPTQLTCGNFLDFSADCLENNEDSPSLLFDEPSKFDLVIANPPYVRTQVMGAKLAQKLARRFNLTGRIDLYHAFIYGIAAVLRSGAVAGLIVSNRFMTTKSGSDVRQSISKQFKILHVWDLGDTRLFEAAVLPAVLLLKKKNGEPSVTPPKFTSIYSTTGEQCASQSVDVITALGKSGVVCIEGNKQYYVRQGTLTCNGGPRGVWRISTLTTDTWLSTVLAHTFCTFGDVGKIRVGVKTTADKVFIRSDWKDMRASERPELLRPLTTHHVARRFKARPTQKQILYPHHVIDGRRNAVNLKDYPRAARYLRHHRATLEARKYVVESGRNWYEIWVPQDPAAWVQPKIVFRDIAETPTFWIDLDGTIVNGDCYWLVCEESQNTDVLWLTLSVGNSSFIEAFYDHQFHNKLYAGRRRFMTQYVEKFPLPDPKSHAARRIIRTAKELYDLVPSVEAQELEMELDGLVWEAFGLAREEVSR